MVAGATVTVQDGADAGRSTTTDTSGHYSLANLSRGGFTVRATATDHEPLSKGVTLVVDTALDFELPKVLKADLVIDGGINERLQADGSYSFPATGLNRGDGCAGSIAGTSDFADAAGKLIASPQWSLPGTTIVRPGERFTYQICCLSRDQVFGAGAGASYVTRFTFVTVPCP